MAAPTRRRRTREPDSVRLPLPGQDPTREAQVRAQVAEQFKPQGPIEDMWVEDIAWCSTNIEYIRAMIVAHRKRCIERAAHGRRRGGLDPTTGKQEEGNPLVSDRDLGFLETMERVDYSPPGGISFLGNATFAGLLGDFSDREQQQMRELQIMLHEEVGERNRAIHQITRTRQQDMAEAVAVLEAQGWVHPERALAIEAQDNDENVAASDAVITVQADDV